MTKVAFASDLHQDHKIGNIEWPEAEVCVIGGDTGNSVVEVVKLANILVERYPEVVFVDGNHEHYSNFYGQLTVEDTLAQLVEYLPNRAHLLGHHMPSINLAGVNFVGCNGWYSFDAGGGDPVENRVRWKQTMDDHRMIRFDEILQSPPWDRAVDDAAMMDREIAKLSAPIVAVTHTAPHRDMVTWKGIHGWDSMNSFFVNTHMSAVLEKHAEKIAIWYNGHTHERQARTINGVYCLANPYGYPHERPANWEPVVLEV